MVGGIIAFIRWYKTESGKKIVDKLMLKAPIFGPILVKVNVARFARTFGSLMASGISVLDAINATKTALGSSVYKEELAHRGAKSQKRPADERADPLKQELFRRLWARCSPWARRRARLIRFLLKAGGILREGSGHGGGWHYVDHRADFDHRAGRNGGLHCDFGVWADFEYW
jgi:hypothetical protein